MMPYIKVTPSALTSAVDAFQRCSAKLKQIEADFSGIAYRLDWDVQAASNVEKRVRYIESDLEEQSKRIQKMQSFVAYAYDKYDECQNTSDDKSSTGWFGYEISDSGIIGKAISGWIGKIEAQGETEWGNGKISATFGKAESKADFDFSFFEKKKKREYKDGKWEEDDSFEVIKAEVDVGASVQFAELTAEGSVGNDYAGLEGDVDIDVGVASATGKGELSIGEEGINAYVSGEAMVAAAKGEAKGTVNILGFEISVSASGYAGALGVEGEAGIKDGKFVMKGGGAAGVGGSLGIEIGFNETGWKNTVENFNNFVDWVVFWN